MMMMMKRKMRRLIGIRNVTRIIKNKIKKIVIKKKSHNQTNMNKKRR